MGSNFSKKSVKIKNIKINDYSKVKIPKEYTLLKLASYNISLTNTINLNQKIKDVISYIFSKFNNKEIDVINLQEINDTSSLYIFVSEFKKYCLERQVVYYFSPQYDNIGPSSNSQKASITTSEKMIELSFGSSEKIKPDIKKKKVMQNIIISKFPIISSIFTELDDKTDMDDILGVQTFIGANLLIGSAIISIYNTNLSKDIKAAQIVNDNVRKTELEILLNTININKKTLESDEKFNKYIKTDIHIVAGTFHIPEIDHDNNNLCDEYRELLTNNHFIDIFRMLTESEYGFTTISKERINYIFLHMTEDFYKIDSEYFNIIAKKKNVQVLKNNLFKRYKIHFMDYYRIDSYDNVSVYFPVECIFIVNNR